MKIHRESHCLSNSVTLPSRLDSQCICTQLLVAHGLSGLKANDIVESTTVARMLYGVSGSCLMALYSTGGSDSGPAATGYIRLSLEHRILLSKSRLNYLINSFTLSVIDVIVE